MHNNDEKAFTKSTVWFDDTNGWRSSQGGLSAIRAVTTDANNMGGFFVRKLGGAAGVGLHLQKLLPFLFLDEGSTRVIWAAGHYIPVLLCSIVVNICTTTFYLLYLEDMRNSENGAHMLPSLMIVALTVESLVMAVYTYFAHKSTKKYKKIMQNKKEPVSKLPEGKTPKSVTSRIVTRTVTIVSGIISMIALRDLLFPGQIISFIPHDDIYLEWTGAFIHSPPEGSPEYEKNGLSSSLYISDLYMSQLCALQMLCLCLYKFLTAYLIPHGQNKNGEIKCKMIWKAQFIADGCVVLVFRMFAAAAKSASLDLRWHLICLCYETFILGEFSLKKKRLLPVIIILFRGKCTENSSSVFYLFCVSCNICFHLL